jgi:hypothetical protein
MAPDCMSLMSWNVHRETEGGWIRQFSWYSLYFLQFISAVLILHYTKLISLSIVRVLRWLKIFLSLACKLVSVLPLSVHLDML